MVAKRPDFRRLACAFSSGTGICSKARGRTSTRARSHVRGAGRARGGRLLSGTESRALRSRRRRGRPTGAARRTAPGLRPRPLRGLRAQLLQDLTTVRARALRGCERAGAREPPARRPRVREPRPPGRRGRGGYRRTLRRQGARLRARVLDPRERGARRGGARGARRAGAVFVGSAHIRGVLEEVVGHVDRVHQVPPGVDVDEFRPRGATKRSRTSSPMPPGPAQSRKREERLPDEGNAGRLERFFEGDAADRRLLRQAPLQQGRPPAGRGAARPRRPRADRRLRRLPEPARSARRRGTRSSPGRSSIGISCSCSRSATRASCRRSSRRRSGWSPRKPPRRASPARRSPLGPGGGRGRPRGGVSGATPVARGVRERRLDRAARRSCTTCSRSRPAERRRSAPPRGGSRERWSWKSVAERSARALLGVAFTSMGEAQTRSVAGAARDGPRAVRRGAPTSRSRSRRSSPSSTRSRSGSSNRFEDLQAAARGPRSSRISSAS